MDERIKELITKYIDGFAKEEEIKKIIEENPEIIEEIKELKELKEVINMLKPVDPDRKWEDFTKSLYSRIERSIGWIFLSIGLIITISFGLIQFIQELLKDTELPLYFKIGIFSLVFGIVVLIVSLLRERIFMSRYDKYKEVER